MGRNGRPAKGGQGSLDWGLQLQRGPDGAHQEDRAHHLQPTTLLHVEPRGGDNDPAILQEERYWRDQLCPDAFRSFDWGHDQGACCSLHERRFSPECEELPGTSAIVEPCGRGIYRENRK